MKTLTSKELGEMLMEQREKNDEKQALYIMRDGLDYIDCSFDCEACEKKEQEKRNRFHEATKAYEKKYGVNWFTGKPTEQPYYDLF